MRARPRRVVLIGGTGAGTLVPAAATEHPIEPNRYGTPSGYLLRWTVADTEVFYLPRHGAGGALAPHRVNYRANIWALRDLAPDKVIGINAVGGIADGCWPGRVLLPAQIIDYTWGRAHTFFDEGDPVRHVEFDPPFSEIVRAELIRAGRAAAVDALEGGTYGVTQGPRLETAAEIDRLAADGCDMVGMTAMPEAALAREVSLPYAVCAVVVNRAAGRLLPGASIHGELRQFVGEGMDRIARLLSAYFA